MTPGSNSIPVTATDGSGNASTKTIAVTVAGGANRSLNYDDNGNLTDDGAGKTYAYDAVNRLVKIAQSAGVTEFVYNGKGERIQEKLNGTLIKTWIWAGGPQPAEERDSSGSVTKRFYALGQMNGAQKYFYAMDHLGSVRELTDPSGTVHARYSYDPYGRSIRLSGDIESDFGFTGFYRHQSSGLNLTIYRAYDAELGRWLSRDPVAESVGLNRYKYGNNDPLRNIDLDGRDAITLGLGLGFTGAGGAAALNTAIASNPAGWMAGAFFVGAAAGTFIDRHFGVSDWIADQIVRRTTVTDIDGKPPFKGPPGGIIRGPQKTRRYGPDGYPEVDRDAPHPDHSWPGDDDHSHDWGRPSDGIPTHEDRGPPRAPNPSDPPPARDTAGC